MCLRPVRDVHPTVAFIDGCRLPFRAAETDPHGLACLKDHRDSAVAVCFLVVVALLCRSCLLCPLFTTTGAHGPDSAEICGGSAVAVPRVVDVAVLCSDKLSRDSESVTDSVHRQSQWTFQSPQRQVAQSQLCMVGLWRR